MTMKKLLHPLVELGLLVAIMLVAFSATGHAATAATGDDGSLTDLLRPVYDAFRGGHYIAAGALALVLVVALLKRYAPGKLGAFVHGDAGGVLTTLAISFAGAIAAATGDGQAWTWSIAWTAGGIAFAAAGSYAMIKKLLVEPLLASAWWQAKAPAWLKAGAQMVLWIFDKPAARAETIKAAEKAGEAAVQAEPSKGADEIAGPPETF